MEDFAKNVISFEDHPLVAHKITKLRDINTGSKEFSEIITELTILMGYEALKDLKTREIEVEAPLTTMKSPVLAETFTIVPILRAGLGMVDGLKTLLPTARVGYVGLYRDQETLQPVTYYFKMPVDAENDRRSSSIRRWLPEAVSPQRSNTSRKPATTRSRSCRSSLPMSVLS